MDFNSTVKGSLLEGFYPEGWDFEKIDKCCANAPESVGERQDFWNKDFMPIECKDVAEFDVKMGHEIANEIRKANAEKRKIAFILPVGPMGMYKWAVYFLKEWNESCENVWCFNMDEWADGEGNTITGEAAQGDESLENMYTTVAEAKEYLENTGVDALTVAIGSAHGVYKKKPKLNIERLKEIADAVSVPLVLHGGSGLSDDDFKNTIREGIAKVNIFTDLCLAGERAMKDGAEK